jgi:hypothetical protein
MAYAKELEAEQARRRSRREPVDPGPRAGHPASAGYPGAWDEDEFESPRVAAR